MSVLLQATSIEQWFDALKAPTIEFAHLPQFAYPIAVLRDDVRGGALSGNKARKLKYALLHAKKTGIRTLVSMGGRFSNHLHALAHAGAHFGFETHAFIRGEEHTPLSPTLQDCAAQGMRFSFVTRERFRALRTNPAAEFSPLSSALWLPEGGGGALALPGLKELGAEIPRQYTRILLAAGTGVSALGVSMGLSGGEVWAVPVLKQGAYLRASIKPFIATPEIIQPKIPVRWLVNHHEGGYGKVSEPLNDFCQQFNAQNSFAIEPIYTGKVFFAAQKLLKAKKIRCPDRLLIIHTGGMQGARSLAD